MSISESGQSILLSLCSKTQSVFLESYILTIGRALLCHPSQSEFREDPAPPEILKKPWKKATWTWTLLLYILDLAQTTQLSLCSTSVVNHVLIDTYMTTRPAVFVHFDCALQHSTICYSGDQEVVRTSQDRSIFERHVSQFYIILPVPGNAQPAQPYLRA